MTTTVLAVDFEACDSAGTWIAFAAGVFSYPDGTAVERLVRIVKRPMEVYDYQRKAFWLNRHPKAHEWLQERAQAIETAEAAETELAQFVREAHRRYPQLQVISDNPTFDLRLLDNILCSRGLPPCSIRADMSWTHAICTYSHAISAQQWIGTRNLDAMHRSMFGGTSNRTVSDKDPLHTPWKDLITMVNNYFMVQDILLHCQMPKKYI